MEAYKTFKQIKNLSAFSVPNAKRRNINQHARRYSFNDGSALQIHKAGFAKVFNPQGFCVVIGNIAVNSFGA